MMRVYCILFTLLITPLFSHSQQTSDVLYRDYTPVSFWFTPRVQYFTKSQSFFYYEGNVRYRSDLKFAPTFPFNTFYRVYNMLGYEHKASDNWYLGASVKAVNFAYSKPIVYTRFNIQHIGNIKSVKFFKELGFDYINNPRSDNPNVLDMDEGRVSFSAALLKRFYTSTKKTLDVFVSARAFVLFDFLNDGFSGYDTRRFDVTRLSLGCNYFIHPSFVAGVFGMLETDYYYSINVGKTGKINSITPTIGLNLICLIRNNLPSEEEAPYYYFKF